MAAREYTASNASAITPHDTNKIDGTAGIYVGGTGNLKVDMCGGDTGITFAGVPAGTILPIQVVKVYATGTSATNIVGLY